MKKFCNLIIIDASASMISKIDEVKSGLKQLFSSIRHDALTSKQRTIVCDFSGAGDFRVLTNVKGTDLSDDIADKYGIRDRTALYDSIYKGINEIPKKNYDGVFIKRSVKPTHQNVGGM